MNIFEDTTLVAFDTETTGPYPVHDEICEIAAVKWRAGQTVSQFQSLIKPKKKMGDFVISIHGITNEMVEGAPSVEEVVPKFFDFIQGSILMAHHAAFDMGFMAVEFEKLGLDLPKDGALCTSLISQTIVKGTENHRLQTLVKHFGIQGGQAHRALDDSISCLNVGLKVFEQMGSDRSLERLYQTQGGKLLWSRFSLKEIEQRPHGPMLIEAIHSEGPLEIVYHRGSQPGVPRVIWPKGLVRSPQGDYIVSKEGDQDKKRFYLQFVEKLCPHSVLQKFI